MIIKIEQHIETHFDPSLFDLEKGGYAHDVEYSCDEGTDSDVCLKVDKVPV